jgi:hypothetical protein
VRYRLFLGASTPVLYVLSPGCTVKHRLKEVASELHCPSKDAGLGLLRSRCLSCCRNFSLSALRPLDHEPIGSIQCQGDLVSMQAHQQ